MLWSFFHLDNMDEKEQADRMAAAEALYMISTRLDKSGPVKKTTRIGRRKKNIEDIGRKRKSGIENEHDVRVNSSSNRRGHSKREAREGRGASVSRRGRGGRGGRSSPRGRGGAGQSSSSVRVPSRQSIDDINNETLQRNSDNYRQLRHSLTVGEKVLPEHDENSKKKSRTRTTKIRNQRTKSDSPSSVYVDYSRAPEADDKCHQAVGFTGAAISLSESSNKRSSFDSSQNLQSQGLVSGFKQVSLTSSTLSSTATVYGLPSMNLASFTTDLNLPSIPLEIGSLQLSSQPTPNLSSLGDMTEGVMEDDCSFANRKKSEKFLPLKKRKLHNPSEAEVREPIPSIEASSLSDSEERSEAQLSPLPPAEPVRASFTVQAPPIITMQTLMEIKTALTADDDGDLPLHIAVVHENMRMVIKLINLMRIAGKGVDKFNKQQQTPLHLAVKLNFLEAIDILLKSNANVNAVDCTGSSCIHMAVQGRSAECLTMLLGRCPNADLNVRNFDGLTPLHIAVDNGDLQQVETLLKYNADIDVTDGKSGRTALFRAAESNQKGMVELLLSKGANPDVPNYAGVTTAMAAQGRNLHGVLKLLGSIATDKFTEYETKSSGLTVESKPTSLYLGFPSSDSLTLSQHNPGRGIHAGPEITCLIEPKVSTETAEMPSNETKVFHNVFVLSQSKEKNNQTKSKSEPSSPEVKMEVIEDKDMETCGLMSLPEGIFCSSEEERGDKQLVRQRRVVTVGHSGSVTPSQAKLHVPVYSKVIKNTEPALLRSEQKSVLLQIVPPHNSVSASDTASSTLTSSTTNAAPSVLSDLSLKPLSVSFKPVSVAPAVVPFTPSTTPPSGLPSSSSDTVTLTGMQARLFQVLLKMYNIDPGNEVPASSSNSQPISSPLSSVPPKLSLPQSSSLLSPTVSPSAISVSQKQGSLAQSYNQQNSKNPDGLAAASHDQDTGNDRSSHSNQLPLSQHKLVGILGNSYDHRSENGVNMDVEGMKTEESPLNLSTASNRQDNQETGYTSRTVNPTPSEDVGTSVVTGVKPGLSPVHLGSKGKVISIGVRRISDGDKGSKMGNESSSQFEMFLLPTSGQTQIPDAMPSGQIEATNFTTTRAVSAANVSQEKSAATQPEHKLSGDITPVSSFPHLTTSVSQKTASKVRDYLFQQNQIHFHNYSPSTQPSSAPAPVSPIQASVPTVLDSAAETSSSAQKKHLITVTRNPSTIVTMGKTIPYAAASPVSSTLLLPAVSSSPIFLHQGQVIDLSKGRVTEPTRLTTPNFPSSSRAEAGQGKVIGFSGAILSVVPPKIEQPEKRLPKEAAPKEAPKKRGRKTQKVMQGSTSAAETGLGKINSETDEKLKKFLDAKKSENTFPVLTNTVDGMFGLQEEQTSGGDIENGEALGTHSESGLSEGQVDQTYKTVGIFSGNVQHVKVGKKFMSPSPFTSHAAPLSASSLISPTVSSSLDSKPSGNTTAVIISEGGNGSVENTGFTLSTEQASLGTTIKNLPSSGSEVNKSDEDNLPVDLFACVSKYVGTRLPAGDDPVLSKKSKKRSTKPSLFVVDESKERIAAILNRKGQSSQPERLGEDSDNNSDNFVSREVEKFESSQIKKKALPTDEELSCDQGLEEQRKNLSSSISLETVISLDGTSGENYNVQSPSSNRDPDRKPKKHRRQIKSGPQGKEQVHKYVPVNTNEQAPCEDGKTFVTASSDNGLASTAKDVSNVDNQKAFSSALSDSERTEVSNMEVDDDDGDEQPALVIEEAEEMD